MGKIDDMSEGIKGDPLDPGFPELTNGTVQGTIQDIDIENFTAKIHLDDGSVHDVVYSPQYVQKDNKMVPMFVDGDRVSWHLVAEDGWINAYDFYPVE